MNINQKITDILIGLLTPCHLCIVSCHTTHSRPGHSNQITDFVWICESYVYCHGVIKKSSFLSCMDGCDIKIIAGLRKLKILFNDKLEIKSLLMTKNHHNDVYKLTKTSQFTATINAYLMISHKIGFISYFFITVVMIKTCALANENSRYVVVTFKRFKINPNFLNNKLFQYTIYAQR